MNTVDLLLISIFSIGALIVIGLLLKLMLVGRINRMAHEMHEVYGEEHDIKKRIEQYISKKVSDELGNVIVGYRESLEHESQQVVAQMEAGTKQHLDSLGKFILQQEALITKQAEYIVGSIVKNVQGEIETYKKNQMEGIDAEVREIVTRVAPEVLGKSINIDDHEDLVWKALEKAKKGGLFVRGLGDSKAAGVSAGTNGAKVVNGSKSKSKVKGVSQNSKARS